MTPSPGRQDRPATQFPPCAPFGRPSLIGLHAIFFFCTREKPDGRSQGCTTPGERWPREERRHPRAVEVATATSTRRPPLRHQSRPYRHPGRLRSQSAVVFAHLQCRSYEPNIGKFQLRFGLVITVFHLPPTSFIYRCRPEPRLRPASAANSPARGQANNVLWLV